MGSKNNGNKTNGSGNGHDPETEKPAKVIHFPTLAERDRARKEALKKEQAQERKEQGWRMAHQVSAAGNAAQPFFNFGRIPPFTKFLTAAIVIIQITLTLFADPGQRLQLYYMLGFVPAYFSGAATPFPLTALLGPVTHMFIHGGWVHVGFNAIMMITIGMFFEKQMGTRMSIFFFFVCGLAGALTAFIFNPFSPAPLIGASGSLNGYFAATLIMLSRRNPNLGRRGILPVILFWIAFMIASGMLMGDNTAWQAHIGGFLAGIGLLHLAEKGKIRL